MNEETVLAGIADLKLYIHSEVKRLETTLVSKIADYALEVGEYRRVALDCFNQLIVQAVDIQQLKDRCETLEAKVILAGKNGSPSSAPAEHP